MKETVKINVETLTKQVEDGMKKDELAAHYGIPVTQMTKALQQAGLKIRKFHRPAFTLVSGVDAAPADTSISGDDTSSDDAGVAVEVPTTPDVPADSAEETIPSTEETPEAEVAEWKD